MALSLSSSNLKLFLAFSVVISLLSTSASARPCKTLLISSYTFSIRPLYPNPDPKPSSSGFVTVITEITQQRSSSEIFLDRVDDHVSSETQHPSVLPFGLSSYDMNSLRDRTKDILRVVVALLFGVGCGALTAATMYLVWSLFSPHRYDEFDEDEEDDVSPKKIMGYFKIPDADYLPKQVKDAV